MRQFCELDVSAAVAVYGLEEGLPLVDVLEKVAELVHVYRAGLVAVKHFYMGNICERWFSKRRRKTVSFRS